MNEFDINKIQLTIQSPDVTIDGAFNDFLLEHIEKLGVLYSRIHKCDLMLRHESNRKGIMEADIKIHTPGNILYATGRNENLTTAVTEAFHDVTQQLVKYKERQKDHHQEVSNAITEEDLRDEESA